MIFWVGILVIFYPLKDILSSRGRDLVLGLSSSTALSRLFMSNCALSLRRRFWLHDGPCPRLLRDDNILINVTSGWLTVDWFNHTSWTAVVTRTDRPQSARNRCVIDVLVAFLCFLLVVEFSFDIGAFIIGLSQMSFCFSLIVSRDSVSSATCVCFQMGGVQHALADVTMIEPVDDQEWCYDNCP